MISDSRRFQLRKSRFGGMAILGPRNWQPQRQCGHRTRPTPIVPMSDGFLCVISRHVFRLTAVRHLKQTQVPLHIARMMLKAKKLSHGYLKSKLSKPSSLAVLIQSLMASSAFLIVFCRVLPCAMQPGSSGTSTTYASSSALHQMIILKLLAFMVGL
jgi:hypothetical protein